MQRVAALAHRAAQVDHGSVQLTTAGGTLDCAPAALRRPQPGEFAFDANVDTPVFATAVDGATPPPDDPPPLPAATPGPTPPPTPTPRPILKAPAGTIASSKLTSRGGKVELRLRCPSGSARCRGTITVQTAGKPTRSLTARASYSIAPGKQRTITLKLSAAGRRAIKQKRSVRVRVTIKTSAGVSASRRLNLQRRGS